ncbi:hypothetical protein CCACVL1_06053 [Corchorus capsularis]|uniref:Uncharacterized protein n=1 Tax=Corchorus capsularis TaxID=210143 RepID=A0A1R3JHT1_COCAP|nr:hypothetical protein CCACVL1_06053 [Corchorus capsularis]
MSGPPLARGLKLDLGIAIIAMEVAIYKYWFRLRKHL